MLRYVLAVFCFCLTPSAGFAQEHDFRLVIHSEKWIKKEGELRHSSWDRKIYEVNSFLNAHPHELWLGSSGARFIREGNKETSKCGDYAQTKHLMLKNLGISSKIIVALLRQKAEDSPKVLHAYVRVEKSDNVVGLDNRFREPIGAQELAHHYEPLETFAGNSLTINEILAQAKEKESPN